MSDEATAVRWSRPTRNRHGQTVYASKCGRFSIVRFRYILPVSISYTLVDSRDHWSSERDRLADCKRLANYLVTL